MNENDLPSPATGPHNQTSDESSFGIPNSTTKGVSIAICKAPAQKIVKIECFFKNKEKNCGRKMNIQIEVLRKRLLSREVAEWKEVFCSKGNFLFLVSFLRFF